MFDVLLLLLVLPFSTYAQNLHLDDPSLFSFVTRPDLRPPKWDITIYNASRLSPGYWFAAPKIQTERTIGTKFEWTAPAIYDGKGDLVWSGATQMDTSNFNDFRVSEIDGEKVLTMYDLNRRFGLVLDTHYRIRHIVPVPGNDNPPESNAHEFNFVDNGKRVLVIQNHRQEATEWEKEAVGFEGDVCWANYNKFLEIDVTTGEVVFKFDSHGKIGVDEADTVHAGQGVKEKCKNNWDHMHTNSVDKCDDGHYLFNARHSSTIYKISKDDGSIVWRLGGKKSDFFMNDVLFSRQHHIRVRGQNETHMLISMMDNALGEDQAQATWTNSRGLLISLNTVNMTASLVAHYDHPDYGYAFRRGNMQMLNNGNVFLGWSEHGLMSEHAADGTVLMKAQLLGWLGNYRNYKFNFVGRPLTKPDVDTAVYFGQNGTTYTRAYVSWNGDTEVRTWIMYRVSADGEDRKKINSTERTGFETYMQASGYSEYIQLEGVDKDGQTVGRSNVVKTTEHPSDPFEAEPQRLPEFRPDMRAQYRMEL